MIDFRLHMTLRGTPDRPTEDARDRLDRALARWNWGSSDSRAAARAITGELVDGALRHARPASDVGVQLTRSGHRLRIAVTADAPPDRTWVPGPHAARWGTTGHPHGRTTVWCELLDIPMPRRPARSEVARTQAA
jgi:hypothetical protein